MPAGNSNSSQRVGIFITIRPHHITPKVTVPQKLPPSKPRGYSSWVLTPGWLFWNTGVLLMRWHHLTRNWRTWRTRTAIPVKPQFLEPTVIPTSSIITASAKKKQQNTRYYDKNEKPLTPLFVEIVFEARSVLSHLRFGLKEMWSGEKLTDLMW